MDLAHIALIAGLCLADGILVLWDRSGRAHRWVSGSWIESLARRFGSPIGEMRRAAGSVRP
jgi:hypothetical protein